MERWGACVCMVCCVVRPSQGLDWVARVLALVATKQCSTALTTPFPPATLNLASSQRLEAISTAKSSQIGAQSSSNAVLDTPTAIAQDQASNNSTS